jgi:ABC-type bacteriocin/lantibiotic exporter with double-glycine peptidase domain
MYTQKKDGWCGPASISYLLHQQGKEISQEEVASKTHTTVENGVDPKPIIDFLQDLGFSTKVISDMPKKLAMRDILQMKKDGMSVLIDYLDGTSLKEDGHYSVFEGLENNKIKLFDPQEGKVISMPKNKFLDNWKDTKKDGSIFRTLAIGIIK